LATVNIFKIALPVARSRVLPKNVLSKNLKNSILAIDVKTRKKVENSEHVAAVVVGGDQIRRIFANSPIAYFGQLKSLKEWGCNQRV
jgi:hypothetical protein